MRQVIDRRTGHGTISQSETSHEVQYTLEVYQNYVDTSTLAGGRSMAPSTKEIHGHLEFKEGSRFSNGLMVGQCILHLQDGDSLKIIITDSGRFTGSGDFFREQKS